MKRFMTVSCVVSVVLFSAGGFADNAFVPYAGSAGVGSLSHDVGGELLLGTRPGLCDDLVFSDCRS